MAGATKQVSVDGGDFSAEFEAASDDGSRVLFSTTEAIDGSDADDNASDIYEWSGGSPALVTPADCSGGCGGATFKAVSDDFSHLVFSTVERLDPDNKDTDGRTDIYRQTTGGGGTPELVSAAADGCPACGNADKDATFNRASADTEQVAFTTEEVLRADDKDGEGDIYARDLSTSPTGTTSLVTTSPSYCPLKPGNCGATFAGASSDGRHFYFSSVERFTLDDGNEEVDVYERFLANPPAGDETRLISVGNAPSLDLGPPPPDLEGTDPPSPGSSTTPRIVGVAESGSLIKIYTTPECDGEPVATGTAAQLGSPGLLVTVAARSLTMFRATAETEGFVSACSTPLTYVEDSEPPPGGGSGGSGGPSTTTVRTGETSCEAPFQASATTRKSAVPGTSCATVNVAVPVVDSVAVAYVVQPPAPSRSSVTGRPARAGVRVATAMLLPPRTPVAGRVSDAACVRIVSVRLRVVTAARLRPARVAAGALTR